METKNLKLLEKTFRRQDWIGYLDNGNPEHNKIVFDYKDGSKATYYLNSLEYPLWRSKLFQIQNEKKIIVNNNSGSDIKDGEIEVVSDFKKKKSGIIFNNSLIDKINGIEINIK